MADSNLSPLDLAEAEINLVDPDVLKSAQRARATRGAKPRSKTQQVIDDLVRQAYQKWVAAGKPKAFADSPGGRITVLASQQVQVERAIRKAGSYLNLSIRFGEFGENNGKVEVVFRASDPRAKGESDLLG